MSAGIEFLPWDTEFFGFPVAKVSLNDATPKSLARIDDEARDMGIRCLYGSLDASPETTAFLVQEFDHRLVEVAQTFSRPAIPFTPRPTDATVRQGTLDDIPLLEDAFELLAPWSRFGADPRFGLDAARRMHRAWVERAAAETDERLFIVAEDASGVIGVSTHVRSPVPRVDFMSVTNPSTEAAQALMVALIEWAEGGATEAGPCAARNIPPIRYLEGCGFKLARVQYLYHRWYDEES